MTGRRIETQTSRTAQWTCVCRAASSLESDDHYRVEDQVALRLVPTPLKLSLHIPLIRRLCTRILAPKGIYEYTIARTKYIDGVFKNTLDDGVVQVLIFGAGFDTRAIRFQDDAADAQIFELDVPITQQAKLRQYGKRRLRIPRNAHFVAIDFDRESTPDILEAAGFRSDTKSLFVLEGVLMYLQPRSVDETFSVIEAYAGEGSVVVFDYVRASVLRHEGSCYGEEEILKSVTQAGERWSFGIEEWEIEGFLRKYGLRLGECMDAHELERMYFTDSSGRRVGRVNGTHCLVRAVKPAGR